MRKTTLSALLAAGILAVAGIAQANTFDSPTQAGEASTMTNGVPNQATTNSPFPDGYNPTIVMGAGPYVTDSTVTTYTYSYPYTTTYTYTYPARGYLVPAPGAESSWNGYLNSPTETTGN